MTNNPLKNGNGRPASISIPPFFITLILKKMELESRRWWGTNQRHFEIFLHFFCNLTVKVNWIALGKWELNWRWMFSARPCNRKRLKCVAWFKNYVQKIDIHHDESVSAVPSPSRLLLLPEKRAKKGRSKQFVEIRKKNIIKENQQHSALLSARLVLVIAQQQQPPLIPLLWLLLWTLEDKQSFFSKSEQRR